MSFAIQLRPSEAGSTADAQETGAAAAPPPQVAPLVGRLALDGRILHMSPSCREILGLAPEHLVGQNIWALIHPRDADALPGGGSLPVTAVLGDRTTVRLRHRQGHWVCLDTEVTLGRGADGRVTEVEVCARDVTNRHGADVQVDQDSRLESLGRLSAGLAHEINSPIQFVGDNARFLAATYDDLLRILKLYRDLLETDPMPPRDERLAQIRAAEDSIEFDYLQAEIPSAVEQTLEGIQRVSSIVRAMKMFSHPGNKEQVPADLNEALHATVTVTRHQVNSVAELHLDLADIPPVRCNIADLNQVFLNLIINAADAIAETGVPGVIDVSTVLDGDDVVVTITDTGTGIADDVSARMFDPFFTTKEVGRGSGQGLPLARAVVHEGHGGVLSVESTVGIGSSFTVRLPVDGGYDAVRA